MSKKMEETDKDFTPRSYQLEILEAARAKNTIACLGTGTGKTFIAVMLIQEFAEDVRLPYEGDGKRIFFLVPTVPLVHQQSKTISNHTDLKVKKFSGDMNVDSWNKDKWTKEFIESEVLVMTAEIFRIILDHTFIPLTKIKLIIFDECHRAQGDHPYCQAMKCFTSFEEEQLPKIFGLSASLINGKCRPTQLEKQLIELEKTLRSSITTASDVIDLQKYGADPDEYIVCNKPFFIETLLFSKIEVLRKEIKCRESNLGRNNEDLIDLDLEFFDKPLRCLNALEATLKELGFWCACTAASVFLEEISEVLKKQVIFRPKEEQVLKDLCTFLTSFIDECNKLSIEFTKENLPKFPHKLLRLLDIFLAVKNSDKFKKQTASVINTSFSDDPEKYHQMLKKREEESLAEIQLCSIVFVEKRITAFVLQQWLLKVREVLPELSFLIPEYIVGHGSTGVKQTSMSENRQKTVLADFRKKLCNVLISTNVLEEGMDVQQCNLVVRFDLPGDFRGYVQSKGRARAKNSVYVLMSEKGEKHNRFLLDMCNFKTVEKMLLDKCQNRTVPDEDEIREFMENDCVPPYMPYGKQGPRITLVSAISLINRYCSSLPSDMATKLTAKWHIRLVDPDSPVTEYECALKMPINSPLKYTIVGPKMKRKKLAKMAAALKACECLYEEGELNEHLVPVSSLLQEKIEEELGSLEEEDGKGAIPGTNKRRQEYDKHIPVFLQDSQPKDLAPSYLHIFKMELIEPLPDILNPRKRPTNDPNDSPRGLGILLSKKLPKINSFPIFTKIGIVKVTILLNEKEELLSNEQLQKIEEFHKFLFSKALHYVKNKEFDPASSKLPFYVVPVNKGLLDWSFIDAVMKHPFKDLIKKTPKTVERTTFQENLFKEAVLLKSYKMDCWKYEKPSYHHVIRITDLKPTSACGFSDFSPTFNDYYRAKYDLEILDQNQPLIDTFTNGASVNWKPLYVSVKEVFTTDSKLSKTKERHKNYHEYLVPELCIIHPFPTSFFLKVQYLPTILFRLHSLLLAEEIRQSIATCGLVGKVLLSQDYQWPFFDLGTSDKDLRKHLNGLGLVSLRAAASPPEDIKKRGDKIVSFTRNVDLDNHPGPNPSLILQALTVKSAGDEFDLERLEMIGDSFLKYVISVKTYIKYPNFDEGKLTKLRSSLIQNLHLYQLAKKKNLGDFLICTSFNCEVTWLPPCYTVTEKVDERILHPKCSSDDKSKPKYQYFTKQVVSDKCIADAVEALIGAYLLSCGQKGALMFMHWIGLDPLPKKVNSEVTREDFLNWPPEPPSVIVGQVPNPEECLQRLTSGFSRFESAINYKFKDKALLLQAFTHPSYHYNEITDCYQRLEFLGDAVLDFLITRQLYEDPHGHSPGSLTDLRSALVNNIYFACLAIKYGYHKYIRMLSPHLFGLMKKFIELFEPSDYFKFFKDHGYALEEIECFELDEVEVPKSLGDLFESVAGAIYLDSGMSLDTVWKVYYPMLQPAIDHLTEHVPKSPVRELYELLKRKDVFKEIKKGEKSYAIVTLPNGKEIEGVGPNKKVAKRSAAKRALAELRQENETKNSHADVRRKNKFKDIGKKIEIKVEETGNDEANIDLSVIKQEEMGDEHITGFSEVVKSEVEEKQDKNGFDALRENSMKMSIDEKDVEQENGILKTIKTETIPEFTHVGTKRKTEESPPDICIIEEKKRKLLNS